MYIAIVKEDFKFSDRTLDGLGDFFQAANIREQTGATFYQYLLCPEYYDAKVVELKGGDCDSLH